MPATENPEPQAAVGFDAERSEEMKKLLCFRAFPSFLPNVLKHTLLTLPVCPVRETAYAPVCASHTFTVWSTLPAAMRVPSGLKHTLLTVPVCR